MKLILSVDSIKFPLTGIGRYTSELASQFARRPDELEVLRYLRGSALCDSIELPPPGRTQHSGFRRLILKSDIAVSCYRAGSAWLKARALRGLEDHLVHGPNFYVPPFDGKTVVTFHDLSPYVLPDCHPAERVRYMRREIERSLRQASMFITDSEFTRQEMASYFSVPINMIRAVPLASAAEFHPRRREELQPLLSQFGLSYKGYCLFVGTIEPRKNIGALLDAYELLPEVLRERWPLVLAGYSGWNSENIHSRIERLRRSGWLRYLGFVSSEDLPKLMAGAQLFVFPSLYEGFGLPILEAMASGVPVVCANNSSLPEVAGNAAILCDAHDVGELAASIRRGLEDREWRSAAVSSGFERSRLFSWERCADETLNAYRSITAG